MQKSDVSGQVNSDLTKGHVQSQAHVCGQAVRLQEEQRHLFEIRKVGCDSSDYIQDLQSFNVKARVIEVSLGTSRLPDASIAVKAPDSADEEEASLQCTYFISHPMTLVHADEALSICDREGLPHEKYTKHRR